MRSFLKKHGLVLKSSNLIFFAALYFSFVLNFSFWRHIFRIVDINSISVAVFTVSLLFFIFVPLYLIFSLIIVPYAAKPLLILLLLISSTTNYVMFRYGVLIDADMIRNAFETNTREAMDLVTVSSCLWVFLTGVIPAVLTACLRIEYRPFARELKQRAARCALALGIFLVLAGTSYKEYASFGRNNRQVRKAVNTLNYTYAAIRYFQKKSEANREFLTIDRQAELVPYEDPHKTVLIFIVGETARSRNFSLGGYDRKTNPLLEKEDIVYFSDFTSCGTATAVSLPCMFSHHPREKFKVDDAKYTENLLDILKTGGYEIIWRDNDDGCKGVCDRVKTEYMVQTNNPKYCNGKYCHDEALLDGLEDILKNTQKDTVIVLHTMGSHGPTYYNRYPDKFKVFTPTCDTADIQNCTQKEIVNTYDNTIVYTDYIVAKTIEILKKFPEFESGLIYSSDHGESLGENGIYLHGIPYKFAPAEQKEIPMVMWMSETMKKYDYIDYDCLKQKAAGTYTHDNLYHSLLSLMEIKSKTYDASFDIFKSCRLKTPPAEMRKE